MKTIGLTPQPRHDLSDRRRQAQDRRVFQRLSARLRSDEGRSREAIADLLGVSARQVGQWLRLFRNQGRDELCTRHYPGHPGRLGPARVQRLKREVATGVVPGAEPVRTGIEATVGVADSATGVKDWLHRIGASFHTVSGSFGKADVEEPMRWVRKYRRHKRQAGPTTRR